MSIANDDGRRTPTDGRRLDGYTISSPCEPNGSGELKIHFSVKNSKRNYSDNENERDNFRDSINRFQIADRRCVSGTTFVGDLPIRQIPDTCLQYCGFFYFFSNLTIYGLLSLIWFVVNGCNVIIYILR